MLVEHGLYPRKNVDVIDYFERKILRKMLGPTQAKGVRRST